MRKNLCERFKLKMKNIGRALIKVGSLCDGESNERENFKIGIGLHETDW